MHMTLLSLDQLKEVPLQLAHLSWQALSLWPAQAKLLYHRGHQFSMLSFSALLRPVGSVKDLELLLQSCMCGDGVCGHMGGASTHRQHWPAAYWSLRFAATGRQPCACCTHLQVSLLALQTYTLVFRNHMHPEHAAELQFKMCDGAQ